MIQIGTNFWNLRGSFTFAFGAIDIGTHMSFIKLPTGKFLVVDTCDFSETDKRRIDELTENGNLIEAVIATHPFHTVFFPKFYKLYPNAAYYGTPRHMKKIELPWAGDLTKEENLNRWQDSGIQMRIADGGDINTPIESNHFSGIFVFHEESKTIHNDDTILYFENPGIVLRCLGHGHDSMQFWDLKKGINHNHEAPLQFKSFIEKIIQDWDFDNIVAAHTGNKIGGAKELLRRTIEKATPLLNKLSETYKR